ISLSLFLTYLGWKEGFAHEYHQDLRNPVRDILSLSLLSLSSLYLSLSLSLSISLYLSLSLSIFLYLSLSFSFLSLSLSLSHTTLEGRKASHTNIIRI